MYLYGPTHYMHVPFLRAHFFLLRFSLLVWWRWLLPCSAHRMRFWVEKEEEEAEGKTRKANKSQNVRGKHRILRCSVCIFLFLFRVISPYRIRCCQFRQNGTRKKKSWGEAFKKRSLFWLCFVLEVYSRDFLVALLRSASFSLERVAWSLWYIYENHKNTHGKQVSALPRVPTEPS